MKITFFIILISFSIQSFSQILNNKLTVSISKSWEYMTGDDYISSGEYVIPSIYSGFTNNRSYGISGYYKIVDNIYTGLDITFSKYRNWEIPSESLYSSSEIRQTLISGNIRIINPLKPKIPRKFFYYVHGGFSIGPESIILKNIMMVSGTARDPSIINTVSTSIGWSSGIGFGFQVFNCHGILMEAGYASNKSNSPVSLKDKSERLYIKTGIFITMLKKKQYYY